MEISNKRQSHHLVCLSSLSQAPLLASANENGSERSTPVSSAHQPPIGSPNKLHQKPIGTPVPMVANLQTSVFFPPPPASKAASQQLHQISSFAGQQHSPDMNINGKQEFNRGSKRISPSSVSANQSFTGFFQPPPIVQRPICSSSFNKSIANSNSTIARDTNNNSARQDWAQQDENYHVYHEPIDTDDPSPSPPPKPTSSSFAERASHDQGDEVSRHIYKCYVTLNKNGRSEQRSRSYHGPKNANSQIKAPQTPLIMDTATKNLSSTSVAHLPTSPTTNLGSNLLPIQFRDHCVRELIETESNYVYALEMIITCFAKPLEDLLKREENQLIFGHIKYFYNIHSAFKADLERAAFRSLGKDMGNLTIPNDNNNSTRSNPPTPTAPGRFLNSPPLSSPTAANGSLSSCFLNFKDKFYKYGEYCASLSRAQALLDELTKHEHIATKLDQCQQVANEGKFKLRDLLSLPMQRILKYHLLLAQLIKNTPPSSDDYHGLKRAHEAMVDLGQDINEVKRDTEAIVIINEIEKSMTGLDMPENTRLIDYGRLVIDGFVRIKVPGSESKSKPLHDAKLRPKRYVFVFDKVMLMCKVSGVRGLFQYKEAIVLSEYDIEPNPPSNQNELNPKLAIKDKWSYQFNLVRLSDKTTYCLFAKTMDMKNKWIASIKKAMDNTRPSVCRNNETNHEFLMHTFDKPSSCDHCGRLFHGLYYQGYRCRTCFTSAHKRCLTLVRPCGPALPSKTNKLPPSPSVNSTCSDDARGVLMQFPNNSSSSPCVDVISKNQYSNLKGRAGDQVTTTSSFREAGPRSGALSNQRPVSSMINVSMQNQTNTSGHGDLVNSYVNFTLSDQPWFCGRMERDTAQSLLEQMPHETFLVRVSPKHNGSYVISLNYHGQIKHMRIYVSKENQLYLSQNRFFKSVTELVSWYERNSLVESFHMLDAKLSIPFKPSQVRL